MYTALASGNDVSMIVIVYITFACKPNRKGCYGDVQYYGTKTYNWNTQWARQNYNIAGTGGAKNINKTLVGLGDGVGVIAKVAYDNGVRADDDVCR